MKNIILFICTIFPSNLRLLVWRLLGFKVGKRAHVSIFSLVVADFIDIGSGAAIDSLTFIYRPSNLIIGKRARIGSFIRIIGWRGDINLGPQTLLALGCLIDSTGGFSLGSKSQIGPRSIVYTHGDSSLSFNVKYPIRNGPVIIGDNTWIGMSCIISANTKIGSKVIIYPGTRVLRNVQDGKSLVPLDVENRSIQTDTFIQMGIADNILHDKILNLFKQFANNLGVSASLDKKTLMWKIKKNNFPTMYLILEENYEVENFFAKTRDSIVWKLYHNSKINSENIIFCFNDWTIYGSMTNFTEIIADFLMRKGGPHFIYK